MSASGTHRLAWESIDKQGGTDRLIIEQMKESWGGRWAGAGRFARRKEHSGLNRTFFRGGISDSHSDSKV